MECYRGLSFALFSLFATQVTYKDWLALANYIFMSMMWISKNISSFRKIISIFIWSWFEYFSKIFPRQMLLDPDKTSLITSRTRQTNIPINPTIETRNKTINKDDNITFLGLEMDRITTCNLHSEKVMSKISS